MSEGGRLISIKRLKGQSALFSGANSGIGEAVAKALAAEGAKVVVNYAANKSGLLQMNRTMFRGQPSLLPVV